MCQFKIMAAVPSPMQCFREGQMQFRKQKACLPSFTYSPGLCSKVSDAHLSFSLNYCFELQNKQISLQPDTPSKYLIFSKYCDHHPSSSSNMMTIIHHPLSTRENSPIPFHYLFLLSLDSIM